MQFFTTDLQSLNKIYPKSSKMVEKTLIEVDGHLKAESTCLVGTLSFLQKGPFLQSNNTLCELTSTFNDKTGIVWGPTLIDT